MLIIDSREKKYDHIVKYLDRHGVEYKKEKLDVGDYQNTDFPKLSVDRKQNLDEIASNLCTPDSRRFWRELRRSQKAGMHLFILIEHRGIKTIDDVRNWNSSFSKITGDMVANEMFRAEISYNVRFLFCDKNSTGKRICELLGII